MDDEPGSPLPIEAAEGGASMSLSDVNLGAKSPRSNRSNDLYLNENSETNSETVHDDDVNDVTLAQNNRGSCRKWCYVSVALIFLFALGLGLGLGLKGRGSSQQGVPPSSSFSKPHHSAPTDEPRPTFDEIVDYLSKGVSDYDDLTTLGTPQNLAARWMAEEDGLAIPLPNHVGWKHTVHRDAYMYMFRYVMALNYFALDGPNWLFDMNFLTDNPICQWNQVSFGNTDTGRVYEIGGVTCDPDTNLPIAVDLEFNNMSGEIPKENGLLGSLQLFDLEHNTLEGEIPEELCTLYGLTFLLLQNTNLGGEIPSCINNLENLEVLRLDNNNFSGEIPPEICALIDLEYIVLDKNLFSGSLPECIGDLTSLTFVSMSDNNFEGELPDFSLMSDLEQLYLDDNEFEGFPIDSLFDMANLEFLYLENNNFEGDIHEYGRDMPNLMALDMSSNLFTSQDPDDEYYEFRYGIPRHFFNIQNLTILDLSNNLLEGEFPVDIPVQDKMLFFSVHDNDFSGPLPAGLKNLTALVHLDLATNDFEGTIPNEFFEMPELIHLFLSENENLTPGPVPDALKDMTQLTEISFKNTARTGALPPLLNFDALFLLDLDNNDFEGTVPASYGQLSNLRYLLINRNPKLVGTIPEFIGTNNFNTLLVDGTQITGDFSSICALPGFTGEIQFPTDAIALADCSDPDSGIDCDCCHCCAADDDTCSDAKVASLDWDWQAGFRRTTRNFAIDLDAYEPPESPLPRIDSD